jgi:hypothetical protein
MDEIRRRWMHLPVKLTDDELEGKKVELVDWTRTRAANEADMEAWLSEVKDEKKLKESTILAAGGYAKRAADIIKSGEESRDVEVADNFDGGNIVTIRLDTYEVVSSRPANEDERQLILAMPKEPSAVAPCEPGEHYPVDGVCQKCGADEEGDDGSPSDAVS